MVSAARRLGPGGREALFREPDSIEYLANAESLWQSGTFCRGAEPEIVRTPGYPLFLVPGVVWGQVDLWAVVGQGALGAAAVWLTIRWGRALGLSPRAAGLAGWFLALEPLTVLYSAKLLREALFTPWWLLILLALPRVLRPQAGRGDLIGLGCLVAVAAFVRPIAYFLPGVLAALVLCPWSGAASPPFVRRLSHALVLLAVSVPPLAAWQVRNVRVADYQGFAAVSELDLYFLHAAALRARLEGRPFSQIDHHDFAGFLAAHPELRDQPRGKWFAVMGREARTMIGGHPLDYLPIHLRGMLQTLIDNGTNAVLDFVGLLPETGRGERTTRPSSRIERWRRALRERPWEVATWVVLEGVLVARLALAAGGLWLLSRRRIAGWGAVLVLCGYLWFLSGGPVGRHRFRLPLEPLVCLAAAVAVDRWRGPAAEQERLTPQPTS